MEFQPGRPSGNLMRRLLGLGADPSQHFYVSFAGLNFGQHRGMINARESKKSAIERAVVVIFTAFIGDHGAGLVE